MSMSDATDELRRLLDERGVEWEDASPVPSMKPWKTSFTSFTGEEVTIGAYDEPKWLMGTMVFYTPAQVIAATLGSGTCHVESSIIDTYEYNRWEYELSCGHTIIWEDSEPPRFCPDCGRRVE